MSISDFEEILTVEPCIYWYVRYAEFCNHPDYNPPVPNLRCPFLCNQSKCEYYKCESDLNG